MKAKTFIMDNPREIIPGRYDIGITIDEKYIPFIESLAGVDHVMSYPESVIHHRIFLDPRYDVEEVWLHIYEQLDAETSKVKLSDIWGLDEGGE